MYRLDLTFWKGELDAGGAAATMAAAGGYLVTAELSGLVLPIGAHAPARSRRAQRTLFMPWAVVYICTRILQNSAKCSVPLALPLSLANQPLHLLDLTPLVNPGELHTESRPPRLPTRR